MLGMTHEYYLYPTGSMNQLAIDSRTLFYQQLNGFIKDKCLDRIIQPQVGRV